MKHPASKALFSYWNACRGEAAAPSRSAFDPAAVREILGDIFVAGPDTAGEIRFRVAGTRICALFGRDLKAVPFEMLWRRPDRSRVRDLAEIVIGERQACVIGAEGHDGGVRHAVELLLLPFEHHFPGIATFTGAIVPLQAPKTAPVTAPTDAIRELTLATWRWIEKAAPHGSPPRRHPLARGVTLYQTIPGAKPVARIFRRITR
jgi:hypothetical protein